MAVSLNVDLGESDDEPAELYELATVVNVACGGHAGDLESMSRACGLALRAGARLVAHPSYPDRANFGRVSMKLEAVQLIDSLCSQLNDLWTLARELGLRVEAVKAHGALYHDANQRADMAQTLLQAVSLVFDGGVALVGAPGRELALRTREAARPFWREGFADRAYRADGSLVSRSEPDALLTDVAAVRAQAVKLAETGLYDTLCLHGDTPGAASLVRAARESLEAAGQLG